jgi:catechol 2,3-dioxygenase-like lactoylglutathione lyase family enzyme
MIKGVDHLAISTGDIERLSAFYKEQLGFEHVYDRDWVAGDATLDRITGLRDSEARVTMLRLGKVSLELFEFRSPEPKPNDPGRPACDHGITHLSLSVNDLRSEYERLRANGMRFHCPPQEFNGGTVQATYGRDPDGNIIELVERDILHE